MVLNLWVIQNGPRKSSPPSVLHVSLFEQLINSCAVIIPLPPPVVVLDRILLAWTHQSS
jgi:hypothetical protein